MTVSTRISSEKDSPEFKPTLDGEALGGEVVFPLIGQTRVERRAVLLGDLGRVASPGGLDLIELLLGSLLPLDLFGILLLLLVGFLLFLLRFLPNLLQSSQNASMKEALHKRRTF